MKHSFNIAITFLLVAGATLQAGDILGVVKAEGKKVVGAGSEVGKYDNRKFKFVEKVNYAAMHDFVVYIDGPVPGVTNLAAKLVQVTTTREISQQSARFTPHVLPVMVGTTVEWPNNDNIYHNVFSYSDAKQFDLGLYKGGEVKKVVFDKPGEVDVFCSIHTSMSCVVLVLQNPFFASTDSRGRYVIRNVPPGTYKLKSWHERMPPQTIEVKVPAEGEVTVDFTMGIRGLPQY